MSIANLRRICNDGTASMSCLLDASASGSKAKELLERGGFEGVEESLYIIWPPRLQELLSTFSDK